MAQCVIVLLLSNVSVFSVAQQSSSSSSSEMFYTCDITTCSSSSACRCASPVAPFREPPQLIAITFAGTVSKALADRIAELPSITTKCSSVLPFTIFADSSFSDTQVVRQLFSAGHEVGLQVTTLADAAAISVSHQRFGLPPKAMAGFTVSSSCDSPPAARKMLSDAGYSYELALLPPVFWPFTLHHGWPFGCDDGFCRSTVSLPLLEVPTSGRTLSSPPQWKKELQSMLLERLQGSRTPLILDLGPALASDSYADALTAFVQWATTLDVEFVTLSQLDSYVDSGELRCPTPHEPLAECLEPIDGCARGHWAENSCMCLCEAACLDADGRCTLDQLQPNTCLQPPTPPPPASNSSNGTVGSIAEARVTSRVISDDASRSVFVPSTKKESKGLLGSGAIIVAIIVSSGVVAVVIAAVVFATTRTRYRRQLKNDIYSISK